MAALQPVRWGTTSTTCRLRSGSPCPLRRVSRRRCGRGLSSPCSHRRPRSQRWLPISQQPLISQQLRSLLCSLLCSPLRSARRARRCARALAQLSTGVRRQSRRIRGARVPRPRRRRRSRRFRRRVRRGWRLWSKRCERGTGCPRLTRHCCGALRKAVRLPARRRLQREPSGGCAESFRCRSSTRPVRIHSSRALARAAARWIARAAFPKRTCPWRC